ncbi:MAG: protein kinase domain-containing protein, partial [Trebonia sp.]
MTAGLLATDPVALGPYRLLGRLGGGGMGQVFLARSAGGRLVAVKVIRPEFAADPEFRARFTREVANAKNVSGMFTAVLVGADTEGPVPWLATAYIPGPPLSAAVRESGPLPLASVLPLAAGLTEALAAIHAAGVVHRDLKPSNVLLASDGPRVIDFGISQAMEASALTQTGAILGSPGYMSPEQAQGLPVGPASDVFSLGAMLAFAATGAGPFGGGSVAALVYRVVSEAPDLGQVPPELRPLIERCLAKAPGDRPGLADLLSEFGGEVIAENWLPETIADTFPRYEPSARIAELAAGKAPLTDAPAAEIRAPETQAPGTPAPEPPGPQTTGSGKQAPATPATGMPATGAPEPEAPGGAATTWTGRAGPPAGRTSLPALLCRPWPRRRGRAVTAVVAVTIAAIVAGWLTLGTDALGGHADGRAQSLVPVGASAPPTSATRTGGIIAAGGGPGSPKAPVTSHRPTPTVSTSRARPVRPTQQPSPASAATAAAAVHNP